MQTKEKASFIEYINNRTKEAIKAKKNGVHFTSLEELQLEYA